MRQIIRLTLFTLYSRSFVKTINCRLLGSFGYVVKIFVKSCENIWIVLVKAISLHPLFDQEWSAQQKL
jgi:hypothetical protein